MSLTRYAFVTVMVLALVPTVWGQSPVPGPLAGDRLFPKFSGEVEPTNQLTFSLGLSTHFDDNALNNNQNKVSNLIYQVTPGLSWKISRPKWDFAVDSLTPLSYSYNVPLYGLFAQNLIVDLGLRPTPRLKLRIRNNFNRSSDPFDRYSSNGPAIPDQPNPSILGPPAERTMEMAGLDMTYALGAHTNLGASGIFSLINYNALPGGPGFVQPDTYSTSGRVFISHQFTARQTSSLAYNVQRFTFSTGYGALTHSITYYHTLQMTPSMQLSVWAGPEYLRSSIGIPGLPAVGSWSWTAGGQYSWTRGHTGVTASVSREVSDGGGLGYAVELTALDLGIRRQIGKRWVASVTGDYYLNSSIAAQGGYGTSYFSASGSLTRTLTRNLSLTLQYWRARQGASAVGGGGLVPSDHNRAAISLHYSFSRPIGS